MSEPIRERQFPGRLTPLKEGVVREKVRGLGKKLVAGGLFPGDITALNEGAAVIKAHEAALGQPVAPNQVGEVEEKITGKIYSVVYAGAGEVEATRDGEAPVRMSLENWQGKLKMGEFRFTNPMRKPGPASEAT